MEKSSMVNKVNSFFFEDLLYKVTKKFSEGEKCMPFIAALLYMRKMNLEMGAYYDEEIMTNYLKEDKAAVGEKMHQEICDLMSYGIKCLTPMWMKLMLVDLHRMKFDDHEYLDCFDYALDYISRTRNGECTPKVPTGLARLAESFIPAEAESALVPFAGAMDLAMDLEGFDHIDSFEYDHYAWLVGMFRLGLSDKDTHKYTYVCKGKKTWASGFYDAVISFPSSMDYVHMRTSPLFYPMNHEEHTVLVAPSRFFETTLDGGTCVAFAPVSLLLDGTDKYQFRKVMMESHVVDTIILLPSNLLYGTNIQLACVVLKKDSSHVNEVRMIDASEMYTSDGDRNLLDVDKVLAAIHADTQHVSQNVSYDKIEYLDYCWNVREYLQKDDICPEGYTLRRLEDILEMAQLPEWEQNQTGKTVNSEDLSDDWTSPYVDFCEKEDQRIPYGYQRLDKTAILVAKDGALRPSIVKATEASPVWIGRSVSCFIPKADIDPEFLCMTLTKMESPLDGISRYYVSWTYLLHKTIAIPELTLQKSIFRETVREHGLSKVRELGMQKIIDRMKADYINEVRARKHDMKTPMTQLRNSLTLIKELVAELPEEFAARLDKYVSRQQAAMDILSTIVSHLADEDEFAAPESVNIDSVLKSFETATDKYVIRYQRDNVSLEDTGIKTPCLKIGKVDFVRLCENIVSNAIKRGFVKDDEAYELDIKLTVDKGFFVITFSNNGEPMPEGMDKARYGTKGVKGVNSDGTGIGGYIVRSITQHYGGDYDISSTKFADWVITNVIVKLPIYRTENE